MKQTITITLAFLGGIFLANLCFAQAEPPMADDEGFFPPEEVCQVAESYTGQFLKKYLADEHRLEHGWIGNDI